MLKKLNPTQSEIWQKLADHYEDLKGFNLREEFQKSPDRFAKYSLRIEDLFIDYSKNLLNDETLSLLTQLAEDLDLKHGIEEMFSGAKINETEGRAVLHVSLRNPQGEGAPSVDGVNTHEVVEAALEKMKGFSERILSGDWKGYTGKAITDIVNIGIGGSDLGGVMVCEALRPYQKPGITPHFISNIDGAQIYETLSGLDPETTLFIIASKSFRTQETMTNARTARSWFQSFGTTDLDLTRHFVAVSTNIEGVKNFGIAEENIFTFWDWVGGRFSLWSSIGLPIACSVGFENFRKLLDGAHAMDRHFRETPFANNLPVLMALIGIWYNNFYDVETEAILPYDHSLRSFPAYLQQACMESNGKSIDRAGNPLTYNSSPIVWGEPGTNGQHAFYQLIHQGTRIVPSIFIIPAQNAHPHDHQHEILIANFLAQTEALMMGKTEAEVRAEMDPDGTGLSGKDEFKVPFRVFDGNRPTTSIVMNKLTPRALGSLTALFEHKIFVQGYLWNVFSYDQWGVELGKQLANNILKDFEQEEPVTSHDASTNGLTNMFKNIMSTPDPEGVFELQGAIKNYAWGGNSFIPALLDLPNPDGAPHAELWIGAHPTSPSIASNDAESIELSTLIEQNPDRVLGKTVNQAYHGKLPFLMKVLDADKMLSIQTHPNKAKAEAGFKRENELGIPLTSPTRNYRDDNHKPEVVMALTDFWLLCGFKSDADLAKAFDALPEFAPLQEKYGTEGWQGMYELAMKMPQSQVDEMIAPIIGRLEKKADLQQDSADFWALKASRTFLPKEGKYDRGIFSIYFLNLLKLEPGQGLFTPAGVLHSYLQGTCIEVMSTSDNVLRGGLTPKHVDIVELLDNLQFSAFQPQVIAGKTIDPNTTQYDTPIKEFQLQAVRIGAGNSVDFHSGKGPESILILEGAGVLKNGKHGFSYEKGSIFFASAEQAYQLQASAATRMYKVGVPE